MHEGYLKIGTAEIINAARTQAYLEAFLPKIEVRCDYDGLRTALGHAEYTTVSSAPWYKAGRPALDRFYGLLPGKTRGLEDSTRSTPVTELSGDGAVMTNPRYGAREARFTATAFAADDEAMEEGIAWLREVLASDACAGQVAEMFTALPGTIAEADQRRRRLYRTRVTEGPLVQRKLNSKAGSIWEIEFTITAGIPWFYTAPAPVGTLVMDTALNYQDPVDEDCSALTDDAYNDFVDDPFFTGITRPPRAPAILPPNIMAITSWRRKTLALPPAMTGRWGRVSPIVRVNTENAIQHLRLRFYRASAGLSGCDFDAEFLVSYVPATATLTLDAITREATLTLFDGKVVPAGHLLFGSAGRPFVWPSLGGQTDYTMTADLMPGQPGAVVLLDAAVRE